MKTITDQTNNVDNSIHSDIKRNLQSSLVYSVVEVDQTKIELIESIMEFYKKIRVDLFPMLDPKILPKDMESFVEHYVESPDAAFLVALGEDNQVLGTIAYLPYDERFEDLIGSKKEVKTTELVRCFIDAEYRRNGIGTQLFNAVVESIKSRGYESIYLHSHYFLPGGIDFWKAKGFSELLKEMKSADYPTLHMALDV